jgi:hypothetical protein
MKMMNKKQFNSKYAIDMSESHREEDIAGLFNNGGEGGYSVFDNPLKVKAPESTSEGEKLQEMEPGEGTAIDSLAFTPLQTISLQPKNRPRLITPLKNVPFRSQWKADYLPVTPPPGENPDKDPEDDPTHVLEDYQHDPDKWISKVRKSVGESRAMRILRPAAYEARKQKIQNVLQNVQNRNVIAATLELIPETLRRSEAYQCRGCKGNGCIQCHGWGYNRQAAMSLVDISSSAAANNRDNDFHNQKCRGYACSDQCSRGPFIDEQIRIPHAAESNVPLKTADVKAKAGRNTVVDRKLRYTVVDDSLKPIAPALSVLGKKRPEDPLGKYTVCHFMNYDTEQPDANIDDSLSPDSYRDNEGIYNAAGGTRDKQAFAVVTNVNKNGTYDVIYSGRALDKIRTERRERLKGRRGKTAQFPDPSQGLSDVKETDRRFSGVRTQVGNLIRGVTQFMGERSPTNDGRYYKVLRNVPAHYLAPVDDVGAALICDSGKSALTRKKREVKGWFNPKDRTGLRGHRDFTEEQLDQPMTVNVHTRIGHGFSNEELQQAFNTTGNEETLTALGRLRDDVRRDMGIERGNFSSDEDFEKFSKVFDFGHGRGDTLGPLRPSTIESGPSPHSFTGELPTEEPAALEPPKKTFNSAIYDEDIDRPSLNTSGFTIPMAEIPPTVTQAIGNPKPTKDLFSAIQAEEPKKQTTEAPTENPFEGASDELGLNFKLDEPTGESE